MTRRRLSLLALAPFTRPLLAQQRGDAAPSWLDILRKRLPYYGHRNWIVVADSAYPLQSNPGIETIVSGSEHLHVLRVVLDELSNLRHVRPAIYMDKELALVPDSDAPGISSFRQRLTAVAGNQQVFTAPHEEMIHRLDDAAKVFNILIIKTNLTLPYTSVFIELLAAYWTDDAEQRLRQAMGK